MTPLVVRLAAHRTETATQWRRKGQQMQAVGAVAVSVSYRFGRIVQDLERNWKPEIHLTVEVVELQTAV
jgi:hypothetical protein